jgi:hypothetical protein
MGEQKPLYHSEYTSQGALINNVFPDEVKQVLTIIKHIELGENADTNMLAAIAWLAANIPPYKKYFTKYEELINDLEQCRNLRKDWLANTKKGFPITLKKTIFSLYEKWWEAYNASGAGIRGKQYIPFNTRANKAIQSL